MTHRFCAGPVYLHTVPEGQMDTGNIRTAFLQKGSGFKGSHPCLTGEIICIDHQAGKHGVRLDRAKLNAIRNILQDLRNHFTS